LFFIEVIKSDLNNVLADLTAVVHFIFINITNYFENKGVLGFWGDRKSTRL